MFWVLLYVFVNDSSTLFKVALNSFDLMKNVVKNPRCHGNKEILKMANLQIF